MECCWIKPKIINITDKMILMITGSKALETSKRAVVNRFPQRTFSHIRYLLFIFHRNLKHGGAKRSLWFLIYLWKNTLVTFICMGQTGLISTGTSWSKTEDNQKLILRKPIHIQTLKSYWIKLDLIFLSVFCLLRGGNAT